jgi:GGDEF domain-containing protein
MLLDAQAQAASCSEDVLIDVLRAREEALAVQFDSSRLWSAFGQRQPTASIKPRTPNKQAAPQETAQAAVRAKRVCTTPVMGELQFSRELEHALTIGISASRQERSAASLLITSIDQHERVFPPDIHAEDEVEHAFRIASKRLLPDCLLCTALGDRVFAFVVPHCERRVAVEAGHRILAEIRRVLTQSYGAPATNIRLACGVATVALPHKHFQGSDLYAAACRCLSAAQSAGGDAVKSIEIY